MRLRPVAPHRGIQKSEVECRVVADENGPSAGMGADGRADFAEHALQGFGFVDGGAQRMPGIDAVDFQRRRIKPAAFERLHVKGMRCAATHLAGVVYLDDYSRDLQQCISAGVKTAGFHIHDDGRKPRKRRDASSGEAMNTR